MAKLLLWLSFLLLPFLAFAQASSSLQLERVLGTPLFAPTDIAVDRQGNLFILDAEPYYSIQLGMVTKLDPQGRFVERLDVNKANYNGSSMSCEGGTLALDEADNLYVADYGAGEIRKFTPHGQLQQTFRAPTWGPCSWFNPRNLTVDEAGNVYALSTTKLVRFNAQGVLQWEYAPLLTSQPGRADIKLTDVQTDAAGNAYVLTDYYTITKLSPTGQVLQTISVRQAGAYILGGGGSAPVMARDAAGNFYVGIEGGTPVYKFDTTGAYQTSFPTDVFAGRLTLTFDRQGKLYACAMSNRAETPTIFKFDPAGPELARWGGSNRSLFLAQNSRGEYYVYNLNRQQIIKCAADGQELLRFGGPGYSNGQFKPNTGGVAPRFAGLALDGQGNVYTLENSDNSGAATLQKFNSQGHFLQRIHHPVFDQSWSALGGLTVDAANQVYVSDRGRERVYQLTQQGQLLQTLGAAGGVRFHQPQSLATDALGLLYVADSAGRRVQQLTPGGQLLRAMHIPARGNYFNPVNPVGLSVDPAGTVYVSHSGWDSVRVVDRSGRLRRGLRNEFGPVSALSAQPEGGRLLTLRLESDLICAYSTREEERHDSRLYGSVYQELNGDCRRQPAEPGLAGLVVVAEPGNYYGLTDEAGNYMIRVDTGTYTVRPLLAGQPGRVITPQCVSSPLIRVPAPGLTLDGPTFANTVSLAPYLSVQVASNRRRRCFRNVTTISYGNTGFVAAADARVRVALPEQVVLVGADRPYTRDARGHYVFAVGTLAPNQQGTIILQDSVACGNPALRGLTVCTKAWITPTNPVPAAPTWNQAAITINGASEPSNQARFTLTNTGQAATTDSLSLRVYQDTDLALVHRYALAAGDSIVLRVPATGRVVRLESDQPAGHPYKTLAGVNVELAGRASNGAASAAMQAFPPDDAEPEHAVDCQPIVDSFDPNDKQVVPAGVSAQHYTPTNTPLRYQVRFQNTGTDVAYRVVVVDTLAADLDPGTLQMGAASHAYRLHLSGKTRPVLTFTFDNILLPDSSHDQLGSNGFVQFSVQPKAGLAPQTKIENFADIFFDYNEPVRTNPTLNRIYDVPPTVNPAGQLFAQDVIVSPSLQAFAPAWGRAGTLVTLTGHRFAPTTAANRVRFHGVDTPVLSATATTLTVRVPAGATPGPIEVATTDGATRSIASFEAYQVPTLTVLQPNEGVAGSLITLTGTHFSTVATQDTVWFNGIPAQVLQASATTLQVPVPAGATSGLVQLRTLGGGVSSAQPFTVWYPPTITAFSPARGKAGDLLTVTGTGFAPAARSTVSLGGGSAPVLQASSTYLQVRVPVTAQTGKMQLSTPGGTVESMTDFTFLPPPVLTSFSPPQGSVGEVITLTGRNFLVEGRADTVYVGGVPAPVLAATATSTTVRVPRGARSGLWTMAGTGGQAESTQAFTVLDLAPTEAVRVYPNPARGAVTLEWQRADFTLERVQVYNALGQLLFTTDLSKLAEPRQLLTFTGNPTGLFVLVVHTSRGPVTKKITLY